MQTNVPPVLPYAVPRPGHPLWVILGVAGVPIRWVVCMFPALAVVVSAYCVYILPLEPGYTWGLVVLVPAFWCWRSIRWMDRHAAWPNSSRGKPAA